MALGTQLSSATLQSYKELFGLKKSAVVQADNISTPKNGPSCAMEAFRLQIRLMTMATYMPDTHQSLTQC